MKEIVEKLKGIEVKLSREKGKFNLFGLFKTEDSDNKWDILVAASWIKPNDTSVLKLVAEEVQNSLSKDEIINIQRIVLIDSTNPALVSLQKAMHVEHGNAEIINSNFFGFMISHAYLITSQK